MNAPWHNYDFTVNMCDLAPGGKLWEVELLKRLSMDQWQSIAHLVGRPTQEITSDEGERLYASFINIELDLANSDMESLSEGVLCRVRNRVSVFAKRFIEGFFLFGAEEIDEETLAGIETRDDLIATGLPWAYMTNAFIAREGGNTKLKIYKPSGIDAIDYTELGSTPVGIQKQQSTQTTGRMGRFPGDEGGTPLIEGTVTYPVVPESDMNGAGLILFARYTAVMSYAERVLLTEALSPPLSAPMVECLSTERREIHYFANAAPSDDIDVEISIETLPAAGDPSSRYRLPFKLLCRADLYRASDKVLMASSIVRKSVTIPADQKTVIKEADRFLARQES